MKFKEIKNLVYSPVMLIIGGELKLYPVILTEISDNYDNFEVIGIRSLHDISTNDDAVIISLKEPLFMDDSIENPIDQQKRLIRYDNISICKE